MNTRPLVNDNSDAQRGLSCFRRKVTSLRLGVLVFVPSFLVTNMFLWGTGGMQAYLCSSPCTPEHIGNPSFANAL